MWLENITIRTGPGPRVWDVESGSSTHLLPQKVPKQYTKQMLEPERNHIPVQRALSKLKYLILLSSTL